MQRYQWRGQGEMELQVTFLFLLHAFSLADFCQVNIQAWLVKPTSNVSMLVDLVQKGPCPLNSQPPRLRHGPSNPGRPAPSGRRSWGRAPKSERLFQASVAVETDLAGLGGPLHHPPAAQPMGFKLHPQLSGKLTNRQVSWLRVLPSAQGHHQ